MKVFIDGSAGTTGLRIHERLAERRDLELIILSDELRKDNAARKDAINSADIAFLCLPDAAAREAVALIGDEATLKTFYSEDGHIRLQPENPDMEPIIVNDCVILGRVIAVMRYY